MSKFLLNFYIRRRKVKVTSLLNKVGCKLNFHPGSSQIHQHTPNHNLNCRLSSEIDAAWLNLVNSCDTLVWKKTRIKRVHDLETWRLQQKIRIDILSNQVITMWTSFFELNMENLSCFLKKRKRNGLPPRQRNFLFGGSRNKVVIVDTISNEYKWFWRLGLKYFGRKILLVGHKCLIAFVFFVAFRRLRKWSHRHFVYIFTQIIQQLNFGLIFGFLYH